MIEQRSPEWFQARTGRLTGSAWGAALRLSPWQSREDLMRSMVRDALGAEREWSGNVATEFGQYAEDGALFDFTLETGIAVEPQSFIPYENWAGASPDGKASDGGGVEVKVPYGLRKEPVPQFKPIGRDDQPHYYAQLQAEALCMGAPHMHFWQYRPGFTDAAGVGHEAVGKHTIVTRDDEWLNENLPKLKQFHAEFEDALKEPEEYLAPKRIEIDTPSLSKSLKEWDELCEALDNLEERKKDLLAELVELAGGKNALLGGSRKLTKTERKGSIGYAAIVKKELPKFDVEPYRGKSSSFWQLR